jgi:citrate lyase subunit beta/citryl-CoA lyase
MFRSMLFAPANHARRVEKAFQLDADAVILDLEDAVAESEKAKARAQLRIILAAPRTRPAFVRVNGFPTPHFHDDLLAAAAAVADGIILPKVETRDQLVIADWLVGEEEKRQGLKPGAILLIPHFETAAGIGKAVEILSASSRVRWAGFGGGDFTADLNLDPSRDERELAPYRAALVLASRQAGIEPPLDSAWTDLNDLDGLREVAEASRRAGFQGKRCIHPDQIAIVNQVFTPSARDIEKAENVVAAFDQAEASGNAAIRVGDAFVDYPVAARARRVLAIRDRLRASAGSDGE